VGALTSSPVSQSLLDFQNVTFSRGGKNLFLDLNFSVDPEQVVWLQGKNGQGKTSVLKLAMRLAQPDSGVVQWGAVFVGGAAPTYIGHLNGHSADLTVREALTFSSRLHTTSVASDDVSHALKFTSLYALRSRFVRTLSQGEQRRLALTRLLLNKSALWVLDEPLDSLDVASIEMVMGLIADHVDGGGAVLMSSHVPFHVRDLRHLDLASAQTS
jgi:heme exporter protein A